MPSILDKSVCVVGLGYVGLPLAHAFAHKGFKVYGYDISQRRVDELSKGIDRTLELSEKQLKDVAITFSADPKILKEADVIILAIPTPIDDNNNPDLELVESASKAVGQNMKKGAIVVYESTVYPGVTEEICGPILEKESGLKYGVDFFVGYSPERINPGDKEHTIDKIVKVVAGQDEKTTDILCDLYGAIVTVGVHRAANIKVAEMAKAIENAQRDINIAFVNEIAMLSGKIGIKTQDVLKAAQTKWNFLRYQPGLVGGHCIGVDPFYLVEKAKQLGMTTHVITAGRATNDGMAAFVAEQVHTALGKKGKLLVLGLTFKEDIPDTRNSKSEMVIKELQNRGHEVLAHDPFLSEEDMKRTGIARGELPNGPYDGIVLLVPHQFYRKFQLDELIESVRKDGVIYDLKSILDGAAIEKAGRRYLAL